MKPLEPVQNLGTTQILNKFLILLMNRARINAAFISAHLLILLATGCSSPSNHHATAEFSGHAMTMYYRIVIGSVLKSSQEKEVQSLIADTFDEIDRIYNKWNPDSEISLLNKSEKDRRIPLSKELERFLLEMDRLVRLTEGKFDPSIEIVQKLWKKHLDAGTIPKMNEIKKLSEAVGWNKVHLHNGYFWKEHDLLELDLGGAAKGYAIDLIVERLNRSGYRNVYVEWGGEVRTSGKHPDGRPWRILVSSRGIGCPDDALALVDMEDASAATSGDCYQNWTVSEAVYFHIIDPSTCYPLTASPESIFSATIVAETCLTADVLATAAMLFKTSKDSEAWLQKIKAGGLCMRYWISFRESPEEKSRNFSKVDTDPSKGRGK